MNHKLREEVSLNILKCKEMIDSISKINANEALEFSRKLDELISKYKQDSEQLKEGLSTETNVTLEARLVLDLEDLILEFSYLNDLNELENYFSNENILEKEYDDVVLTYNKMSIMLDRISTKIDIEKLIELISKKYNFLYKIVCRAVLEKEELPNIDKTDMNQIKSMIEKELEALNPDISNNLNIDDIKEYIEYLNELKKSKSKNSFFDRIKNSFNQSKVKEKTKVEKYSKNGIFDKMNLVSNDSIDTESKVKKEKLSTAEFEYLLSQRKKDFTSYDLSKVNFKDLDISYTDLEGTGARINPQKLPGKSLREVNLKGLDLRKADFTGVYLFGTNLEGTGAKINPQLVADKNLNATRLTGLDLSEADFTDVNIEFANLEGTGARIDPQKVRFKSLRGTVLTGLDLSSADFSGVRVEVANLEATGARINPQKLSGKSLREVNLKGLDLSKADFTDVYIYRVNLEGTGARIDPQKVKDRNLSETNLKGLDLSEADFTGVYIHGANLEGTGAKIDVQNVRYKHLIDTNLKGLDLSEADFRGVDITGANLEGTGARLIIDGKKIAFEREIVEEIPEVKKR